MSGMRSGISDEISCPSSAVALLGSRTAWETCTVCQHFALVDPVKTSCGHFFCRSCLEKILSFHAAPVPCPCCKQDLLSAGSAIVDLSGKDLEKWKELQVECRGRGCEWTGSVKDAPSHISRCKITQLLIKCEETRQLKRKIEDQAAEHKARLQRYSDRHKVVLGLLKYNLLARKHLTGSICAQIEQNNKLTEAITQLQNENQRNQTAVEEASRLREENQKLRMDNEQSQTAMLAAASL